MSKSNSEFLLSVRACVRVREKRLSESNCLYFMKDGWRVETEQAKRERGQVVRVKELLVLIREEERVRAEDSDKLAGWDGMDSLSLSHSTLLLLTQQLEQLLDNELNMPPMRPQGQVAQLLGLVLAVGNYLNSGSPRGQVGNG